LDFCKINNLATTQDLDKKKNESGVIGLVSEFNLDHLVEEVAMILHTGRTAPGPISSFANQTSTSGIPDPLADQDSKGGELSVVINIEQPNSWKIRSVAGAWRRIVMNILGNSLKWTQHGLIELSLSEVTDQTNADLRLTHLRVTDTGQGIAPEFLKNSAFTPFSQEDALSEGVGLGLSVVHKLVAFLSGHINMRSEIGVGTQVDVYIPSNRRETHIPAHVQSLDESLEFEGTKIPLKASLIGFNAYPDLAETPTGIMTFDAKRMLSIQNALAGVFMAQYGWHITLAESLERGTGDVAVIEEKRFQAMRKGSSSFKFFIILASTPSLLGDTLPANIVLVQQPYVQI
jgi:hypothetical protein